MQRSWQTLDFSVVIPLHVESLTDGQFCCTSSLFGSDLSATESTPEDAVSTFYIRLRDAFEERADIEQALGRAFIQSLFDAQYMAEYLSSTSSSPADTADESPAPSEQENSGE